MIPSDSNQNAHIPSLGWLYIKIHPRISCQYTSKSILHPRPQNFVIRFPGVGNQWFETNTVARTFSCSFASKRYIRAPLPSSNLAKCVLSRAMPRNCQEIPGFLFSFFVLAVQILGDFQALCPISGVFGPKLFLPQKVKRLGYSSLLPAVLQEVTIWELANGDIRWDPKQRSPPKKNKG